MTYPPYSSKTVNGKPLWQWAKEDKLSEIELPSREVEIYDIQLHKITSVSAKVLMSDINTKVRKVNGDFRQDEIIKEWEDVLKNTEVNELPITGIEISCSSGTYIRRLADSFGKKLGIPACLFSLRRTEIGKY